MAETRSEAIHELLLGINNHMRLMSAQLQDQTAGQGSPRLGLCPECLQEWLSAGRPTELQPRAALSWIAHPTGVAMPVCLPHFEMVLKLLKGSQLVEASPVMPSGRLIVPGR